MKQCHEEKKKKEREVKFKLEIECFRMIKKIE